MPDIDRYRDKEKRREYVNRYSREVMKDKRIFTGLYLSLSKDSDIIEKLNSVENKTDYIRGLVRADINK